MNWLFLAVERVGPDVHAARLNLGLNYARLLSNFERTLLVLGRVQPRGDYDRIHSDADAGNEPTDKRGESPAGQLHHHTI